MKKLLFVMLLFSSFSVKAQFPLAGTWNLKAAEVILPDGSRTVDPNYGKDAKGRLIIDANGLYSLQIFRPDRPQFLSGDKSKGSAEEYKSSLLGLSTHIGTIRIVDQKLEFHIDYSAYPNWNNTTQVRTYRLTGNELYYEVPVKSATGTIAVSIWQRL
jgi:hypothetical protein